VKPSSLERQLNRFTHHCSRGYLRWRGLTGDHRGLDPRRGFRELRMKPPGCLTTWTLIANRSG
jgi:hypothetical protein